MRQNLLQKILSAHLVSGKPIPGEDIGLRIAQAFANDATGPIVMLHVEAMGVPWIPLEQAVLYADRTILQTRPEDADEQRYLGAVARRLGAAYSAAGNGVAPIVHLERFAEPGKTLLAADPGATACGAMAMLAIGASSLEVASAMAGAPFYMPMPRAVQVRLTGRLQPWVTPKDVALELIRRLGTRGGIGRILEFGGPALADLAVPDRATIAVTVAETGAVAVLFPSDEQTRRFLESQGRARQFVDLQADPAAEYDEALEIDLGALEPLVARPGSPADVVIVGQESVEVAQVVIGSQSEPSYAALRAVAAVASGRGVAPGVSAAVLPASRQVLLALAQSGDLEKLIASGWRILEPGCGPDLGIGQIPPSGVATLRTFSRNSPGRSGREGDAVYLAGPLVAAAAAITGRLTDPRKLGIEPPVWEGPRRLTLDDRLFVLPDGHPTPVAAGFPEGQTVPATPGMPEGHDGAAAAAGVPGDLAAHAGERAASARRPGHLVIPPLRQPPGVRAEGPVLLKLGDRVGAEDILALTPETVALHTDAVALAEHLFVARDRTFTSRCRAAGGGFLVAGADFGHGPGREATAMALGATGIVAVLARDIARVFRHQLTQFGILPLLLIDPGDLDRIEAGDMLELPDVRGAIMADEPFPVRNVSKGQEIVVRHGLTQRQKEVLLAGGLLPWARRHALAPAIV